EVPRFGSGSEQPTLGGAVPAAVDAPVPRVGKTVPLRRIQNQPAGRSLLDAGQGKAPAWQVEAGPKQRAPRDEILGSLSGGLIAEALQKPPHFRRRGTIDQLIVFPQSALFHHQAQD